MSDENPGHHNKKPMQKEDAPFRILYVDDEPALAEIAREYLEDGNPDFEVITTEDPEEALDILENGNVEGERDAEWDGNTGFGTVGTTAGIDCVVSDYSMPEKNGIELLEEVRESHPDLPFILLTGKGSEEVASEAISAGVTDYLQKSTGTDQYEILAKRIEKAVGMRRSEQGLREKTEQLRVVLDTVGTSVFMKDAEGRYILMNENAKEALGFGDGDVIGATDHDLFPEDVAERFCADDRRVLEEGETVKTEEVLPAADGERTHLTVKSPILDEDGEPYAVCAVSTDITERREREKELRRVSEEYSTVFENVQDPVFLVDVEDGDEFVFSRFNPAYEENTGISEDEARGKTPKELFGEEDGSKIAERYRRCLETGETLSYDETLNVPVGERTYNTQLSPVIVDGEISQIVGSARDITERKEREEELERYETFVEKSSDVLTHVDEDGTVLYQSPSVERVFGYEQGETVGDTVFEYAHPDDRERIAEEFDAILKDPERTTGELEYRVRDADGNYVWVEAVGTDHRDTEVGGFVVNLRDITERKEHEKELERYEAFVENSSDLVTLIDEDGTIRYQSPSAERVLGYDPEDAAGYDVFDFVHPDDRDHLKGIVSELAENPEAEIDESEYRFRHADGSFVWLEGWISDIRDTGAGGFVVVARDVTERREREEEISRLNERLDLAIDGADLGIWDWDVKEDEVTYNDEWAEILGISPEEADPASATELWADRIHTDDVEQTNEQLKKHLRGETERYDAEYRVRTADDDWKWIHSLGHVVERDDDGRAKRVVGVHMDIDERKNREKDLERYEAYIENSSDSVTHVDEEGKIIYRNPSTERVEKEPEDMEGSGAFEHVHPEDKEEVQEAFEKVLSDPDTDKMRVEYRSERADGTYEWVETVATDQTDTDAGGVVANTRVVDERKEREEELERYEAFIENSSDVVTHLDEDGTILYQSPSTERVLGHDPDERVGENGFEYIHPDDREMALEEFERLSEGSVSAIENLEIRYERADGEYVWLDTTGSDQRDTEVGGFVANSREITERKEYEKELQRSQDLLRRTERIADTGGWEIDLRADEVRFTEGLRDILGVPEGYVPGVEEAIETYHPEDRERIRRATEDCAENGEPFDEELRIVPDDEVVWVHVSGEPVREDGDVVGMRGSVRDITGIKQGQKELERSQDLLRRAEEIADTGGWELDKETGELRWTEGTYRIHGLDEDYEPTVEEAISFYHPEDRDVIEYAVERCREEGEPYDEELRLVTDDDEVIWVRSSGEPVYENGEIDGLRGSIRDITDRKRRETNLLSNNKAIRELYEITSDPDLSFEDKIEMVLESTRSRLDVPYAFVTEIDQVKGEQTVTHARGSHKHLQPGDSCPLEQSYCEKTLEESGFLTVHNAPEEGWEGGAAYEKFGLGCYVGAELTVEGETHGTICFADTEPRDEEFTDFECTLVELMANWVSYELERKRSKESLELQKERLDSFASVVSHDLRSPLSVLMGNLELAEETDDSEYFESCRGAVDRMESIIDDLLSLARDVDETGEPEPVPLADIADECWRNTDADTQDAKLRVEADGVVVADKGKLRQMLDNLLRNAVEHGGGDVTVTVSDLSDGDGFRIEDDGEGIPEEERDRVLDAGYTTSEDGTGLGMYIVRQVAEAHGWDLTVTEGEEGGAAFEVTGVERDRDSDRDRDRVET